MTTTIERFTQWAEIHPQKQYNALMGLLSNPMELLACFDEQPGNKARGIDLVMSSLFMLRIEMFLRKLIPEKNLADLNLPLRSDIDVVLSKNENNWTSSDKGTRRTYVSKSFRIHVLIDDDLGDFVAKDTPDNRVKLAKAHSGMWGNKWVLIPNPIYGSWESALYGHDFKIPDKDVLEMKFKSVQGF